MCGLSGSQILSKVDKKMVIPALERRSALVGVAYKQLNRLVITTVSKAVLTVSVL